MTALLTLYIPKPPDNANGRQHWAAANREKKAHWLALKERLWCRVNPKPPRTPLTAVLVRAEWYAERRQWAPDKDNMIRRLKPTIDWLVANDYLVGDDAAHIAWADPVVHIGKRAPYESTVVLTLTDTSSEK